MILLLSILSGESRLLVSWCVGDMCDMVGSDEDLDRSRRPGAGSRWSNIGQVLGGWTIERSDNIVYDLHRTQGNEECMFLGLASKPRATGFSVWATKPAAPIW
jgi:hypothetical protein